MFPFWVVAIAGTRQFASEANQMPNCGITGSPCTCHPGLFTVRDCDQFVCGPCAGPHGSSPQACHRVSTKLAQCLLRTKRRLFRRVAEQRLAHALMGVAASRRTLVRFALTRVNLATGDVFAKWHGRCFVPTYFPITCRSYQNVPLRSWPDSHRIWPHQRRFGSSAGSLLRDSRDPSADGVSTCPTGTGRVLLL